MAKKTETEATPEKPKRTREPKRARLQSFEARDILRSQMKPDPENPRYMDDSGRVGLRRVLEAHGLVDTIVWNEATGELAGGHQRLDILDRDENYYEERNEAGELTHVENDYLLTVAVINMPRQQQRELNAALNNPDIQGMYDLDLLTQWAVSGDVNLFNAGFTEASIEDNLGPDVLNAMVSKYKEAEVLDGVEQHVATEELSNPDAAAAITADIDLIKQRKHEWVEKNRENNDPDHTLVIVFVNPGQRGEFLQELDFDTSKRFLPFDTFADHFQSFAAKYAVMQAISAADPAYDVERVSRFLDWRTPEDYARFMAEQVDRHLRARLNARSLDAKILKLQEPTDGDPTEPTAAPPHGRAVPKDHDASADALAPDQP